MKTTTLSLIVLMSVAAFAQQPGGETSAPSSTASPQTPAASTQSQSFAKFAPGTIIPAELSKSADAKKLKAGDPVEARTSVDMLSNGKIILPRNTKVLGHVTSAKAHSKESPDSMLGIVFDRLVMKDGHELPLQALVQAIGAPLNAFAPTSPTGNASDMSPAAIGSKPGGGSMGGGQRTAATASSQPSYPTNGMPTGTDSTAYRGALSPSSQGIVGIKDLSLNATREASVISSSNKNVHLDGGSQLMLKVQ